MLKEQKVKSKLITKKNKNMPEKSESMASSTVRRRKGVFPHLPCDKKGGWGCYFAKVVKTTRLYSTCLSLSHTNTHTLGGALLPLSSEQECSQTLVQGLVVLCVNYELRVCVCACICVCVRVCAYVCTLQVVHVEASMVHRWVVEFHRGAADWRPLGVTRDRACRLSKKEKKRRWHH